MARYTPKVLMTTVAASTAVALIVIVLVPSLSTLTVALIVASFGIGVAMTAAYSVAGALVPADAHVTGFGLLTTASLIGMAYSPVLAGFLGASDLSVVFLVDVLLMAGLGIAVGLRMRSRAVKPAAAEETDVAVP